MNVDSPSPAPDPPKKVPATKPPPPPPETDAQKAARADKVKEEGNTAFKARRFEDAIELYTKAIGMSSRPFLPLRTHIQCPSPLTHPYKQKYVQNQPTLQTAPHPTCPSKNSVPPSQTANSPQPSNPHLPPLKP